MRSVVGIALLALVAQAAEQAANNTVAATDDDADLNELLSNMDDETMDKVADKLIDKLLGNLTGMFNLDGKDLDTTELFKNLMPAATAGDSDHQPTEEEKAQMEQAAAAEAGVAAALAAAAAETAVALAAQLQDLENNPDALHQALLQYLPEDYASEDAANTDFAPHAEDVCEGQNFNQEECQAQGAGCCFWENNACWAAVDGACQVADEAPQELDEVNEEAPDLMTVIFVGVASVIVGSASTYALLRPRFRMLSDKQLPLLTPA